MSFSARITSAVSVALLAFAVIVLAGSPSQHGGTVPVAAHAHLQAAAAAATPTASATTDGIIWD